MSIFRTFGSQRVRQLERGDQANDDDIDRLIAMALRFVDESRYKKLIPGEVTPLTLGPLISFVLERGAVFFVEVERKNKKAGCCEKEWHPVGFLALVALPHPLTNTPYGDELAWWIEPEHRSGRAGYNLLRAVEEWARQVGLVCLTMVSPDDSSVGTFLERRGYERVETRYQLRLRH